MALYHSFQSSPSPHLRKKRHGWAGKYSNCWPLFKLATALRLALCPHTPRFCATTLSSAPHLACGTASQKSDWFPNRSGIPSYAPMYPLLILRQIRRLHNKFRFVTIRLRLNKPTLTIMAAGLLCARYGAWLLLAQHPPPVDTMITRST